MSDMLVELSQNPWFRQAVKGLGLPLPTPQKLRRPHGPWVERPLQDLDVVVAPSGGALEAALAPALCQAGANPHVVTAAEPAAAWREAGEAYGRPPRIHALGDEAPEDVRAHALLLDGTGLEGPDALRALYEFFHAWLPRLRANGRVIVLGRPPESLTNAGRAAAAAALEGFARSIAKEVGRRGSTAHVVYVGEHAHDRAQPLLRFLLSERSAFLTGQPWRVTDQVAAPDRLPQVRPLEGQVAVVTGAARGIGAATARALAAEGAHVVCLDRPGDEAPNSAVAHEVGGTPLHFDITETEAPGDIAAALKERFGQIHVLVHNAGITRDKTLARMKPEWWDQAVAVNLGAVVKVNGALLEGGLADHGRIVCLSSVAGLAGNVGQTNYAASKAGVVGYVRALAPAIAGRGITINAVAPGFIETRLTRAMPAVTREVARRMSALGQGGEPSDVAELITFLSTPGAVGLTGQVVRACGGMFIGA